jgi:3',5'-cyclic AMP phosphodiesterase CpdA
MKQWFSAILALTIAGCAHVQPHQPEPFKFAQMCDPQFGFGGYDQDILRFRQAAKQINALKPDFVVICGDLVNAANQKSFADFNFARTSLLVPAYCAPGNHDVGNKPTLQTLRAYRKAIGKDYYSFHHKGCVFVVVNTQLWKAPVKIESERHDGWLKSTLAEAAAKQQPIFVVSHYPLFTQSPDEPDGYYNLPLAKRTELLDLFQRSGVVALLSGHTHRTILNSFDDIQLVSGETTSRNFDGRQLGFRLWTIGPSRPYLVDFVPLEKQ